MTIKNSIIVYPTEFTITVGFQFALGCTLSEEYYIKQRLGEAVQDELMAMKKVMCLEAPEGEEIPEFVANSPKVTTKWHN